MRRLNANNAVTSLTATSTSGNLPIHQRSGTKLTVIGVTQSGGNLTITADDIDITGAINAGTNTVTLRPTRSRSRRQHRIDPTVGVLSLSPPTLAFGNAGTLEIGRQRWNWSLTVQHILIRTMFMQGTLKLLGTRSI